MLRPNYIRSLIATWICGTIISLYIPKGFINHLANFGPLQRIRIISYTVWDKPILIGL